MTKRAELLISKKSAAHNFELLLADKPTRLKICAVIKNNGCGLGLEFMSQLATAYKLDYLAVACIEEALQVKPTGIKLLVLGERSLPELKIAAQQGWELQVQSELKAAKFAAECGKLGYKAKVHFKIDTGLSRYGVRWDQAVEQFHRIARLDNLKISGVMTHFAQSDEKNKDYAKLQFQRFSQVLEQIKPQLPPDCIVHACNSGGYLDLADYHADMCRIGVLFTGNYPSRVCRRINIAGKKVAAGNQSAFSHCLYQAAQSW